MPKLPDLMMVLPSSVAFHPCLPSMVLPSVSTAKFSMSRSCTHPSLRERSDRVAMRPLTKPWVSSGPGNTGRGFN